MNPNGEENEIRELFHELRREDERLVPPFARDWAAASSRSEQVRPSGHMFRLPVAASILLILLGGLAFIIFRRSSTQTVSTATPESVTAIVQSTPPLSLRETAPGPPHSSKAERRQAAPQRLVMGSRNEGPRAVRRRPPERPRLSVILISRWRSPTDFLLKSSAEQLLKTVPRLNELPVEIKAIGSDENTGRKKTK